MRQGIKDEFIIRDQTIDSFMTIYEKVLEENEFKFKEKKWDKEILRHKAIWGAGKKSFAVSMVPGGALTKTGNRYGAEAEVSQKGKDVLFKLLVVPYMSLFDRHDIFLLSQGPMERYIDDENCKDKLFKIVTDLRDRDLELVSQT
jgi:hypothetical protein